MLWNQTLTFIRSEHRNSKDFDPEILKTVTLSEKERIQAITAKPWTKQTVEFVTYLFTNENGLKIAKNGLTYTKSFGLNVTLAYKMRLPELWFDEKGKIMLTLSKPYALVET